jgi:hypothetical protein
LWNTRPVHTPDICTSSRLLAHVNWPLQD